MLAPALLRDQLPTLAREIAALPGCPESRAAVHTKLEVTCGRLLFPGGLTAATRRAGAERIVTGRARPYDPSTLRRSLKAVAAVGATAVVERAVERQVERAVGTDGRTILAQTDLFDQPFYTKQPAHAGPIGALNHKLLAGVYFGVTTLYRPAGPVLVYHLSWHKPASPLRDGLEALHADPHRHRWLTAHVQCHTWDRGGCGVGLLQWAHQHQIPYLTVANGWVYLSSQRAPCAFTSTHHPVFVRRDVQVQATRATPVETSPRIVIFPAHPARGAACVRGLRYRTEAVLDDTAIVRMDTVYKGRWPAMENVLKALKAIGFAVNRDRTMVVATSRGTDGTLQRLAAREAVLQGELDALRKEAPSSRVARKIASRERRQAALRTQVQTLKAQPQTRKVRAPTGLELLCKYLQVLLCNALALVLARSPWAPVRALTPARVRDLLWGRPAQMEAAPGHLTLWIDPVVEARSLRLQKELLRLFNDEVPLWLHGARIHLQLAQLPQFNTS